MAQISSRLTLRPPRKVAVRLLSAFAIATAGLVLLPNISAFAQEIVEGAIIGQEVIISEEVSPTTSSPVLNEGQILGTNEIGSFGSNGEVIISEVASGAIVTEKGDETPTVGMVPPNLPTQPVGMHSGLWKWTPLAPHHQSIVEVSCNGGIGTGVVIEIDKSNRIKNGHEGYVLTAWHVVEDDNGEGKIKVSYRSGIGSKKCRIIHADEKKDIALLWVWVPDGIPAAKLGTDPIESGNKLEFAGLGGGSKLKCCIRHFSATASSPSSLEKIFADVPLLPGDSGGPVFNEKHEVVGIISGGWFWFNSGIMSEAGTSIRTTWPARASNIGPIQTLMAKLNEPDASVK